MATGAEPPPSLGALAAQAERVDQGLLAVKREAATRVVSARDPQELVEITVDSSGQVVDAAVNATLVSRVDPKTLANAVLQAAQAAQRKTRRVAAERRSYHLGK